MITLTQNNSRSTVVVAFSDGNIIRNVISDQLVKFHSAAKPIQMYPFLQEDYPNPFGLSEAERVVMISSHLGQDIHMCALQNILNKTGLTEDPLILPADEPHGALANRLWRTQGLPRRKIYHPCAGKHLGYLLLSKEYGEELSCYYKSDSLVQRTVMQRVKKYIGDNRDIHICRDFCGVPTYWVTLSEIAKAYQKLAQNAPYLCCLMSKYCRYVEGDGSLATELMRRYPVIAKTSINNMVAIGIPNSSVGLVIKGSSWSEVSETAQNIIPHYAIPGQ